MRVLLLGAALLSAESVARLHAVAAERDVDLVTEDDADRSNDKVIVLGGGHGHYHGDALSYDPVDMSECSPYFEDWESYWDYVEASLPEPAGCSQSLVRLKAVNERTIPLPPRLRLGAANRRAKDSVWRQPLRRIGEVMAQEPRDSARLQLPLPDSM